MLLCFQLCICCLSFSLLLSVKLQKLIIRAVILLYIADLQLLCCKAIPIIIMKIIISCNNYYVVCMGARPLYYDSLSCLIIRSSILLVRNQVSCTGLSGLVHFLLYMQGHASISRIQPAELRDQEFLHACNFPLLAGKSSQPTFILLYTLLVARVAKVMPASIDLKNLYNCYNVVYFCS